jgi:hypothetical protein
MPHLTDGTNLASDLNALAATAEHNLLIKHGSKEAVQKVVNERLLIVRASLATAGVDVQTLVINTLVANLVRSIPGRTVL